MVWTGDNYFVAVRNYISLIEVLSPANYVRPHIVSRFVFHRNDILTAKELIKRSFL